MERGFIVAAGLFGLTGVAAGAFGAHGLRGSVSPEMLSVWQTAGAYQLWHALALFGVGLALNQRAESAPNRAWVVAGWLFVAGIAAFSGSLYVLVLGGATWLGVITPLGGLSLMAGWLCVILGAWKTPPPQEY